MTAADSVLNRILALPARHDVTIGADEVNTSGHLSLHAMQFHGGEASWFQWVEFGLTDAWITGPDGTSFFTIESHEKFLGELRAGDRYTTHCLPIDRTDKAAHSLAFVVDRTHEQVAAAVETLYVHVSMTTRRAAPIPAMLTEPFDAELARLGDQAWLQPYRTAGARLRR